jgi:hypothetical protein
MAAQTDPLAGSFIVVEYRTSPMTQSFIRGPMKNTYSKFFASMLICMTLSVGAMAGDDIPPTGDNAPPKCGDISCGRVITTKDTILGQVISSLTGVLLGE